jgi:ABC-2 type transport system ATP-binding protein
MDEAQFLADHVAVIAGGRIVAQGPPATLGARDRAEVRIRYRTPTGDAVVPEQYRGHATRDGFAEIRVEDPVRALYDLTSWALGADVRLDGLEVTRPSLEDIYLELTSADDAKAIADGSATP